MKIDDSFGDAIPAASLAAAEALGHAAYRGVRVVAAGTLVVQIGDNTRAVQLLAGETMRLNFAAVVASGSSGCAPLLLFT